MSKTQTSWILELVDHISSPLKKISGGAIKLSNVFGSSSKSVNTDILSINKKLTSLKSKLDKSVNIHEKINIRSEIAALKKELGQIEPSVKKTTSLFDKMIKAGTSGNGMLQNQSAHIMAIGDSFQQLAESLSFADEIGELNNQITQFTDGTPEEINKITGAAYKLSEVFGDGQTELVQAANAMTKNLGGSFEENLALLEKGYEKGANLNQNFLDQMREYPSVFADTQVSAEQMISIITQANKLGVWDDKAIDSLKESWLRLADMTKAQQDLLSGIGLKPQDIVDNYVNKGDMVGAFKLISGKLSEYDNTTKQKVISNLFGGAGEDARGVLLAFKDFETSLDDVQTKTTSWKQTTNAFKGWMADFKFSIFETSKEWLPFVSFGAQGLSTVTNLVPAIGTLKDGFMGMLGGIGKMGKLLKSFSIGTKIATAAQWLFNAAVSANPIGLIIIGITALIAAVIALVYYWEDIVSWFKELSPAAKMALAPVMLIIAPILLIADAIRWVIDNWDMLVDAFVSFGQWLWDNNPYGLLLDGLDMIFPGIKAKLMEMLNWIYEEFIKPITDALGKFGDWFIGDDKKEITINKTSKHLSKEGAAEDGTKNVAKKPNEKTVNNNVAKKSNKNPEKNNGGVLGSALNPKPSVFESNKKTIIIPDKKSEPKAEGSVAGTQAKTVNMQLTVNNNFSLADNLMSKLDKIKQDIMYQIIDAGRDAALSIE